MNRVVMDCAALRATENEHNGINMEGTVAQVYESRKFRGQTTQFFILRDETGSVGVKIADAPFTPEHVGVPVVIDGAVWKSYHDKAKQKDVWYLDAITAVVKYGQIAAAPKLQAPVKKTKDEMEQGMADQMVRSLELAGSILSTNKDVVKILEATKAAGWTSEDLRTVATSMFIEFNRSKGFIK